MRRIIIIAFLILLIPAVVWGWWWMGSKHDTLLFSWDCNSTTVEFSKGDKTATATSEVDLTTNPGKITLVDGTGNGGDYYVFAITGYDIFPKSDVTVEMTININPIVNNAMLFYMTFDVNNYFKLSWNALAGNDIQVTHYGNATGAQVIFNLNLTAGVEYKLIVKASNTLGIAISTDGGKSYMVDSTKKITPMTHAGTSATALRIGNYFATQSVGTIDNVRISYGWRTDI